VAGDQRTGAGLGPAEPSGGPVARALTT